MRDGALLGAVACLLCSLALLIGVLDWGECKTQDLRFRLRGPRASASARKIVVATVDAPTRDAWPEPMALWGNHFADVVASARSRGARALAFDLIPSLAGDSYLLGIAREAYLLAGFPEPIRRRWEARLSESPRLQPDTALLIAMDDASAAGFPLILSDNGELNAELRVQAPLLARVDVALAADGALRRMEFAPEETPLLSVKIARAVGADVPSDGDFGIDFVELTPETAFQRISLYRLADPSRLSLEEKEGLRGAIVLVGSALSERQDIHRAVLGRVFAGVEIQGHALATLLDGRRLRRPSRGFEVLCVLVLGLATFGISVVRPGFAAGLARLVGASLLWLAITQIAFVKFDIWLPLLGVVLSGGLGFAAFHGHRAVRGHSARLLVERVFGDYLSPRIRDFLLESEANRSLGGARVDASVLFFDLRGSTRIAQSADPELILSDLNQLFERIVPCVSEHDGLVLQYMGDGFLAVFGVPVSDARNPAISGLRAMDALCAEMEAINVGRAGEGLPIWRFGIGLHHGPVAWGSLGSRSRPQLTLVGDTVNIASRLQDASKELACRVVVSTATCIAAGESFDGPLIELPIRGRDEPILVSRRYPET